MIKLKLINDIWHVNGTVIRPDGKKVRIRRTTKFGKEQKQYAMVALGQVLSEVLAGGEPSNENIKARLDDAIGRYLARPVRPGKTDVEILTRLSRYMGGRLLSRLRVADFVDYCEGKGTRRHPKPGTVAREMQAINAMLNHARVCGMAVPEIYLQRPRVDDARTRWLTEDERDKLIDACDAEIQGLVTFLFYTGARLGEAFGLTWFDVKNGRAYFVSYKGKRGKKKMRGVPLNSIVEKAMGGVTGDYVFRMPNGEKWLRRKFYDYFYAACERAEIKDFTPHDCRHTFASHLVQRGANLRVVADLLGHSSMQMVMRYSHLAPNHLSEAVELLDC